MCVCHVRSICGGLSAALHALTPTQLLFTEHLLSLYHILLIMIVEFNDMYDTL